MVTAVEVHLRTAAGVSSRAFTSVLEQVTLALEEIDHVAHPSRVTRPSWAVTRTGWSDSGPLVVLTPDVDPRKRSAEDVSRPPQALVDGVLTLGELPEIPSLFSEGIVQRVGALRQQVDRRSRGLDAVTLVSVNGRRSASAEVSEAVARNALAAVESASYAYGSLVGVLDVISSRRSKRRIGLLTDDRLAVTCNVEKLPQHEVVAAFEKRVIVSGLLRRNGRGQPVRLEVDDLELLPGREGVVRAVDLVGAFPELGGDLTAEEFIARQRGE